MESLIEVAEPITHLQGKHWREWCFCEDYSLNRIQLQQFDRLRREANISFEDNPCWDSLSLLHEEYFRVPVSPKGECWPRLGFQSQHPETDFRGGGVLSLKLIILFVRKNKELVMRMEKDKENFLFAVTAINVAFFMKKYFHLANFLVPGRDQNVYCNRRALKNFVRLLVSDEGAFEKMHELFLKFFYLRLWVPAQQNHNNLFLEFNGMFDAMVNAVRAVFEGNDMDSYAEFSVKWAEI